MATRFAQNVFRYYWFLMACVQPVHKLSYLDKILNLNSTHRTIHFWPYLKTRWAEDPKVRLIHVSATRSALLFLYNKLIKLPNLKKRCIRIQFNWNKAKILNNNLENVKDINRHIKHIVKQKCNCYALIVSLKIIKNTKLWI